VEEEEEGEEGEEAEGKRGGETRSCGRRPRVDTLRAGEEVVWDDPEISPKSAFVQVLCFERAPCSIEAFLSAALRLPPTASALRTNSHDRQRPRGGGV
jgi:hypothetical protein